MEIKDSQLILTIIAAIIISIGGTVIVITKLASFVSIGPVTGFAPTDTGTVNITIMAVASIDVNDSMATVNFGACKVPSSITWITSNMTQTTINSSTSMNCTGGNLKRTVLGDGTYLQIVNVGTAVLELNVSTNMDGNGTAGLLGSDQAEIRYKAMEHRSGDCSGTIQNSQWELMRVVNQSTVCSQLEFQLNPTRRSVRVYFNLTIPPDATTGASHKEALLTFIGTGV